MIIGLLYFGHQDVLEIPNSQTFDGEWGTPMVINITADCFRSVPILIHLLWLSSNEQKSYLITKELSLGTLHRCFKSDGNESNDSIFQHIVVGIAPYGGVAVWANGFKKSVLVDWLHAEEVQEVTNELLPMDRQEEALEDYYDYYLTEDDGYYDDISLPPRYLFDRYMQQFCYRYLPMFQQWDEENEQWIQLEPDDETPLPELDYIQDALFDGTHDKLHDDGLMIYHMAGKPKKLALQWHVGKKDYTAHVWMENEEICTVFDRFYGNHRDTKVDFIIRIDPYKKKYQLALYRYGLKKPVTISEDAYQMIVFKDLFEYYRSDNYDQPDGAWDW